MGIRNLWNTLNAVCNRAVEEELAPLLESQLQLLDDPGSNVETATNLVLRTYFSPTPSARHFDYESVTSSFVIGESARIQVVVDGNIFLHHCKHSLTDHHLKTFADKIDAARAIADREERERAWEALNLEIIKHYVRETNGDLVGDYVEDYIEDDAFVLRDLDWDKEYEARPGERCIRYDAFFTTVFHCISRTVKRVVKGLSLNRRVEVDVVVVFDGMSPTVKWPEQYKRRSRELANVIKNSSGEDTKRVRTIENSRLQSVLNGRLKNLARYGKDAMATICRLTAASDVMQHVREYATLLENPLYAKEVIDGYSNESAAAYQLSSFTILPPFYVGEGDVKVVDSLMCPPPNDERWDVSVVVTDDSDILLGVAAVVEKIPSRDVYVYSARQYSESKKRQDEHRFEFGGVQHAVSLLDKSLPSRQAGYYHIKDDFFTRAVRVSSSDLHPLSFVVPILLYGGYEMLPFMISSSKKVDGKKVDLFRAMMNAATKETSFFDILLAAVDAAAPMEGSTTRRRAAAMSKDWPKANERRQKVEEIVTKYLKLLQYTALYTTQQDRLAWYVKPVEFVYEDRVVERDATTNAFVTRPITTMGQNKACRVSLADVASVIRALKASDALESAVDIRAYVIESSGEHLAVSSAIKALSALYMMGAMEFDDDYDNWSDVEALAAVYKWYETRCLCPCIKTMDLRRVLCIFRQSSDWSRTFTTSLIRRAYKKNKRRLSNLRFPSFDAIYNDML